MYVRKQESGTLKGVPGKPRSPGTPGKPVGGAPG